MPTSTKFQVIRALWREKMHVEPRALELAPATVRDSYAHIWEPAELLMAELEALPLVSSFIIGGWIMGTSDI